MERPKKEDYYFIDGSFCYDDYYHALDEYIDHLESKEENFNYKWRKIFASKRYNTDGNIVLSPLEQQELLDDSKPPVKK